jgi:hypothetical protein
VTAELPLPRFEKYPDEKPLLGFTFRVAKGVTIVSAAPITLEAQDKVPDTDDADVPVSGQSFAGSRVEAFFGPGGVEGEEYIAKIKANLSDGQQPLEQRIVIYIKKV